MARQQKLTNIQRLQVVTSRPGEGPTIGFSPHRTSSPDGTTGVTLQLNLGTASVPDRRYVANAAAVVQEKDRVTLIFGQTRLGGIGYRSLVLIGISGAGIHQLLKSSTPMLIAARKYAERYQVPPIPLSEINEDVPGQTVPFIANLATAGFTGRDACMDYYNYSPFSVQIAAGGGEFQAEAVVRVNLPTALMLKIYDRLDELKSELPVDDWKDAHAEDGSDSEDRS